MLLRVREVDRQMYEDVRSGLKSIETRAATSKYDRIASGDTVTFVCGADRLTKTVGKVYRWASVDAMAKDVSFKRIMPRVASLEEAKRTYASYPGYEEKIRDHGLIGFELV